MEQSFLATNLRLQMKLEKDCFMVATILMFKVVVSIDAGLDSCVEEMKRQASNLIMSWPIHERTWSV